MTRATGLRGAIGLLAAVFLPTLTLGCGSPSAPAEIGDADLTVMTYNIFHDFESESHGIPPWRERGDVIVEVIRGASPDLLGLQEAEDWQVAWFLERLPEYAAVARGSFADPQAVGAETVGILYRRELFQLVESGHFWYSESPDTPGSFGAGGFGGLHGPQMATWVRLIQRPNSAARRGLYLFNTHFVADAGADDPELARARSAELLVERIAGRSDTTAFFFITGDLNMTPGDSPLEFLLGRRCLTSVCPEPPPVPPFRMIDAWASVHPGDRTSGTRCNGITGDDGPRIDYVLAWDPGSPNGATVTMAEILAPVSTCPSDHRPVVATFMLPPTASPSPSP